MTDVQTIWFDTPVKVQFGEIVAYDPVWRLVLIDTISGHRETHELYVLSTRDLQQLWAALA